MCVVYKLQIKRGKENKMRERGNFAFSDNVDECWEYEEIPK